MVKVLILGATGFIGLPVAKAFVQAGHTVYGQTRSKSKAAGLIAEEIIPIIAEPSQTSSWKSVIGEQEIDLVIDAVGGDSIKDLATLILDTVKSEADKVRGKEGPPLGYIYASGTWVYGDFLGDLYGSHSDLTPLKRSLPITAWRVPHEQRLISLGTGSTSLITNVIRPALVYGRSGGITSMWFDQVHNKKEAVFFGQKEARIATIHTDDLARLFVLVAEKQLLVKGIIFNAANPYPEPAEHFMNQLVKVAGPAGTIKGPTFKTPTNVFEEAIQSSNLLRPTLGRDLLGWSPRKAPFGEGMEIYYKAWKASQSSSSL